MRIRGQRAARLLHTYDSPLLALPKLVLQTTTLAKYLHEGFPTFLIVNYATLFMISWFMSAYRYYDERSDPHFVQRRVFYSFDLFFAVFAPLEVLIYAYYNFEFDRAVFATRTETMLVGAFDRTARLFADPTEVSLFRLAFQSLQFTSPGSLAIKCVLNVLTISKWWHMITKMAEKDEAQQADPGAAASARFGSFFQRGRWQSMRRILSVAVFGSVGIGTLGYTIVAVVSTRHVCRSHPLCQVPSYRWNIGARHCSCIVFVDRNEIITAYAEWLDPPDTTENLAALAVTGYLQIVQIINRQLPTLPDELRACRSLDQLVLVYTKTLAIPDWATEFTQLEYLHIEGDLTPKQLTVMPRDLFANMPRLAFLHLGSLIKLPELPTFGDLPRLKYLVLAMLHSITEIPSLDSLTDLREFLIVDAIRVYALPSVGHLTKLKVFSLVQRNPVCCNGFVTGHCDLSQFSCRDRTAVGEPRVVCTADRITSADYTQLVALDSGLCTGVLVFDLNDVVPTLASTDVACGGVMYMQCQLNGHVGICFPGRMQPISCQISPLYMRMRRLQVERHVGDPCDRQIEAWLGCGA